MSPQHRAAAGSAAAANQAFADAYLPLSPAAQSAREHAADRGVSPIGPAAAATLTFLAATLRAHAVAEVGTGTGVSAVALLAGMAPDGVLTSIDNETELQLAAREVLTDAGVPRQRARLIAGDALGVLPKLTDAAYDLVFIDGDPLEYVEYVAQAVRLLRSGGILVLHHALWNGQVADPANEDDEPLIVREALEAVRELEGFTSALLPVGDGLLVATKN
ncbi:MAG: O-methyltransferase [Actinobacteria bacterium]|nr:O-methyltransferase [Actinomycetota bacterium]